MEGVFSQDKYLLRRKVFKLAGAVFRIFDENGKLCFFVNQKAFKLKEEIRVYTDEGMTDEVLFIHARKVIDFSSAYDIYDSKSNVKIGALKRKGMKSMIKDEWIILDENDNQIGIISEDSTALALVRRLLTNLVPQSFDGFIGESKVFVFKQYFNPFIFKMALDFTPNFDVLDKRIGICASILIAAIEGRQN